jgi:hypothetical protein
MGVAAGLEFIGKLRRYPNLIAGKKASGPFWDILSG